MDEHVSGTSVWTTDTCHSMVLILQHEFALEDQPFEQEFAPLEDAIGSHARTLEVSMRATNCIRLGWPLLLQVDTVNSIQTLQVTIGITDTVTYAKF
jgi:hypothetical protein